jgi:hypothetical protein
VGGAWEREGAERVHRWQTHSTLAADNAGLAVEESQKAVTLARKASDFAEEAARKAIQKMQTEAEEREPYFVNLGDRPQPRSVEDRHMVRFGPELARGTFLCMLGPIKAAELRANTEQISWLTAVAAEGGDSSTQEAVQVVCAQCAMCARAASVGAYV